MGAGIDDVPAALAVPAPTGGDGRVGAVGGVTVLAAVHEAVAAAVFGGPGPGVVHPSEANEEVGRPGPAAGAASGLVRGGAEAPRDGAARGRSRDGWGGR